MYMYIPWNIELYKLLIEIQNRKTKTTAIALSKAYLTVGQTSLVFHTALLVALDL